MFPTKGEIIANMTANSTLIA